MQKKSLLWVAMTLAVGFRCTVNAAFPTIHVADDASDVELLAANELRNYLGNMTDAQVGLSIGSKLPAGDVLAVGYGAATALGLASSELEGLKNDSYVLSSSREGIPSGSFVASGGKESARGTLFAAYDLLRRLGCKVRRLNAFRFCCASLISSCSLCGTVPSTRLHDARRASCHQACCFAAYGCDLPPTVRIP